jgi:hypothetical protein
MEYEYELAAFASTRVWMPSATPEAFDGLTWDVLCELEEAFDALLWAEEHYESESESESEEEESSNRFSVLM